MGKLNIEKDHPLRKLFRKALDFGFRLNALSDTKIEGYIEEQILCEFIHVENLYRIRNAADKRLEDIADMLAEGDILLNAQSVSREFQVHKHIGDYTLFMLGMFPSALSRRKGKEFIMGRIIVPNANLLDHYMLQGKRSYKIASKFTHRELFLELSSNYLLYKNVLELVRIYLESVKNREFLKAKNIIGGTD
jgi:hypothetical protein